MKEVITCLLAQRKDGKFLRLDEQQHTTSYDFIDNPELAKRTIPHEKEELIKPKSAPYYFENSWRAREIWLVGCKMVPYEITTIITAKKIRI